MKTWNYSHVSECSVGTMVCTCCKRPVTTGDFRYHETSDAFLPQHRECSPGAWWDEVDARRKRLADETAARLLAFREFAMRWDVTSLDEEISHMETLLSNTL